MDLSGAADQPLFYGLFVAVIGGVQLHLCRGDIPLSGVQRVLSVQKGVIREVAQLVLSLCHGVDLFLIGQGTLLGRQRGLGGGEGLVEGLEGEFKLRDGGVVLIEGGLIGILRHLVLVAVLSLLPPGVVHGLLGVLHRPGRAPRFP